MHDPEMQADAAGIAQLIFQTRWHLSRGIRACEFLSAQPACGQGHQGSARAWSWSFREPHLPRQEGVSRGVATFEWCVP